MGGGRTTHGSSVVEIETTSPKALPAGYRRRGTSSGPSPISRAARAQPLRNSCAQGRGQRHCMQSSEGIEGFVGAAQRSRFIAGLSQEVGSSRRAISMVLESRCARLPSPSNEPVGARLTCLSVGFRHLLQPYRLGGQRVGFTRPSRAEFRARLWEGWCIPLRNDRLDGKGRRAEASKTNLCFHPHRVINLQAQAPRPLDRQPLVCGMPRRAH